MTTVGVLLFIKKRLLYLYFLLAYLKDEYSTATFLIVDLIRFFCDLQSADHKVCIDRKSYRKKKAKNKILEV